MNIERLVEKVKGIGTKAREIKLTRQVRDQLEREKKHPPRCQGCTLHRRDLRTSISTEELIRESLLFEVDKS